MADADLIVHNARIATLDSSRAEATALAVRDGRFTAVGSDADVQTQRTARTTVIDANGRRVIPGLNDSHLHAIREGRDRIQAGPNEHEVADQAVKALGRLPVVNFAAGGVATPADAALMMQLGVDGVFVGSGIFKKVKIKTSRSNLLAGQFDSCCEMGFFHIGSCLQGKSGH